jgi:DNA polymerase
MPRRPDQTLAARRRALARAKRLAMSCQRCPLWRTGTQTVFGEGPVGARVMFVGEEPGDREDLEGAPFVGPAGRLLREALAAAGFDEKSVYITNVVKHFKWTPRGKRRIHKRPDQQEIAACLAWLEEEISLVKPRVIVALGVTAASAIAGPAVRVMRDRGRVVPSRFPATVVVTVHPSSLLRIPDAGARKDARRRFEADLRAIAALLKKT